MTGATLFSGFGGADIGMSAAGIDVVWGIEIDDAIASVARANGLPVRTTDITKVDPADYPRVDVLHASTVCKSFSVAKAGREELQIDIDAAEATVRFLEHIEPEIFTLENVWGYRLSESWRIIYSALSRMGYGVGCKKLCAADFGVPQTRERMIVWAFRDGRIVPAPTPTHAENPPVPGLFGQVFPQWIGWYEAIEDLIPDLPESNLADWQMKRLPEELRTMLVHGTSTMELRAPNDPSATVVATVHSKAASPRALLVDGDNAAKEGPVHRDTERPSPSVSGSTQPRAILYDGNDLRDNAGQQYRDTDEPVGPVKADASRCMPRAVLVDGKLGSNSTDMTVRDKSDPSFTVTTSHNNRDVKAAVGVRVVQMTPRCLARFQSFPDSYQLPESRKLACTGIGNAVPPLMQQRLWEHLLRYVDTAESKAA